MSASPMIAAVLEVTTTRRTDPDDSTLPMTWSHVRRTYSASSYVLTWETWATASQPRKMSSKQPGLIEVRRVERQTAGGIGVHGLQEADACVVVDVAHAGSDLVAASERLLHDVPADEAGRTRHRHHAAWLHPRHDAVSLRLSVPRWHSRTTSCRRSPSTARTGCCLAGRRFVASASGDDAAAATTACSPRAATTAAPATATSGATSVDGADDCIAVTPQRAGADGRGQRPSGRGRGDPLHAVRTAS